MGGTENMGRNESMAELLMSIWEGITENRDLPNRQPGFFFRQQRVLLFFRELFCFDSTHILEKLMWTQRKVIFDDAFSNFYYLRGSYLQGFKNSVENMNNLKRHHRRASLLLEVLFCC